MPAEGGGAAAERVLTPAADVQAAARLACTSAICERCLFGFHERDNLPN
jgi:hypothetical protein